MMAMMACEERPSAGIGMTGTLTEASLPANNFTASRTSPSRILESMRLTRGNFLKKRIRSPETPRKPSVTRVLREANTIAAKTPWDTGVISLRTSGFRRAFTLRQHLEDMIEERCGRSIERLEVDRWLKRKEEGIQATEKR
jgi:hypothetical protein